MKLSDYKTDRGFYPGRRVKQFIQGFLEECDVDINIAKKVNNSRSVQSIIILNMIKERIKSRAGDKLWNKKH